MALKPKEKTKIKADVVGGLNNNQIVVKRKVAPQTVQKIRDAVPIEDIRRYQEEQFGKILKGRDKYIDALVDADANELAPDEKTRAFSALDKSYHSTQQLIQQLRGMLTNEDVERVLSLIAGTINSSCSDCPKFEDLAGRIKALEL